MQPAKPKRRTNVTLECPACATRTIVSAREAAPRCRKCTLQLDMVVDAHPRPRRGTVYLDSDWGRA